MSKKIILNANPSDKRSQAVSNEIARFEKHAKSLNQKANDIINTLKKSLETTQEKGLSPEATQDYEGVEREKSFIDNAVSLLNQDIRHIDEWASQSKELERQIADIIDQLEEEKSTIDSRLRKMQTPFLTTADVVKDFESSKQIGRPLLLEGPHGIGKKSLVYALGVEYNHRVIRIHLHKNTNIDNLFFEIDLNEEHVILGPLGHAVIELSKWQSKEDKENMYGDGQEYESDPIPIVMLDGVENVNQETLEKVISELEHDGMSFNIGNFDINYACHVRPFVTIINNPTICNLSFHTINQCVEIKMQMPDMEDLMNITSMFFPSINDDLRKSKIDEYLARKTENSPSTMRGLLEFIHV